MKKKSSMAITTLKCKECGKPFPIPRSNGMRRGNGHKKDIWCPFCNSKQKFVQTKLSAY